MRHRRAKCGRYCFVTRRNWTKEEQQQKKTTTSNLLLSEVISGCGHGGGVCEMACEINLQHQNRAIMTWNDLRNILGKKKKQKPVCKYLQFAQSNRHRSSGTRNNGRHFKRGGTRPFTTPTWYLAQQWKLFPWQCTSCINWEDSRAPSKFLSKTCEWQGCGAATCPLSRLLGRPHQHCQAAAAYRAPATPTTAATRGMNGRTESQSQPGHGAPAA